MLSYDSVLHAPIGDLQATVDDWTAMIGKLETLRDDMQQTVLAPLHASGWTGEDAVAGFAFIEETTKEFEDAVSEATGIRDILDEVCGYIKKAKKRLRVVVEEEAPARRVGVNDKGEAFPALGGPGSDLQYHGEIEYIQKEIDRAIVDATEADENAARALSVNVDEEHDFSAPEHANLDQTETAKSEARFTKSVIHEAE